MKLQDLQLQTPYLTLDGEGEFYDLCEPTPLEEPCLVSFNPDAARLIGLDAEAHRDPLLVELLNGTYLPKGAKPHAMCYAGHQFGHYVPRLGDGRAINLGSVNGWHLQLKGSGETLYSRMADGRAVLRSSIREYLMSEAMHHLGIPTTRALGIIGSNTKVLRDRIEHAAIVLRLSRSWVRFGTFEYFYYTKQYRELEMLAEYVIADSFEDLKGDEDRYFKMFSRIVDSTARLTAQWQAIGFNHGVLNTDNMSVAGVTIDYGPFAMMDDFNYYYVCNHTDRVGRYAYGEQPNISYWNLTMLAKALTPLIPKERTQEKLDDYGAFIYQDAYMDQMRRKLGLEKKEEGDDELIAELVGALHEATVDYTLFFRTLSRYDGEKEPLFDIVMDPLVMDKWLKIYDRRLEKEARTHAQRQEAMLRSNPKYVLKNYMLQEAITLAEKGDFSMVERLLYIAAHPYEELPEYEAYAGDTPEISKNIGLSCSS